MEWNSILGPRISKPKGNGAPDPTNGGNNENHKKSKLGGKTFDGVARSRGYGADSDHWNLCTSGQRGPTKFLYGHAETHSKT